jgi:hypothetical protein
MGCCCCLSAGGVDPDRLHRLAVVGLGHSARGAVHAGEQLCGRGVSALAPGPAARGELAPTREGPRHSQLRAGERDTAARDGRAMICGALVHGCAWHLRLSLRHAGSSLRPFADVPPWSPPPHMPVHHPAHSAHLMTSSLCVRVPAEDRGICHADPRSHSRDQQQ